jgi:uncharacterized membrane protein YgcG
MSALTVLHADTTRTGGKLEHALLELPMIATAVVLQWPMVRSVAQHLLVSDCPDSDQPAAGVARDFESLGNLAKLLGAGGGARGADTRPGSERTGDGDDCDWLPAGSVEAANRHPALAALVVVEAALESAAVNSAAANPAGAAAGTAGTARFNVRLGHLLERHQSAKAAAVDPVGRPVADQCLLAALGRLGQLVSAGRPPFGTHSATGGGGGLDSCFCDTHVVLDGSSSARVAALERCVWRILESTPRSVSALAGAAARQPAESSALESDRPRCQAIALAFFWAAARLPPDTARRTMAAESDDGVGNWAAAHVRQYCTLLAHPQSEAGGACRVGQLVQQQVRDGAHPPPPPMCACACGRTKPTARRLNDLHVHTWWCLVSALTARSGSRLPPCARRCHPQNVRRALRTQVSAALQCGGALGAETASGRGGGAGGVGGAGGASSAGGGAAACAALRSQLTALRCVDPQLADELQTQAAGGVAQAVPRPRKKARPE